MKTTRKIIEIDRDKCNGCGACVPDCAEGAIEIRNGKAEIIKDSFCDGLGACLGSCPQDALRIIEREAVPFDEEAALAHVHANGGGHGGVPGGVPGGGCPGSAVHSSGPVGDAGAATGDIPASQMRHWPAKLRLVPPTAPFLQGADVVLLADCGALAYPGVHQRYLKDKVAIIACPKFEEMDASVDRLAAIFDTARPASLTVVRMEVPCCAGLERMVDAALAKAQYTPATTVEVLTRGGTLVAEDASAGLTAL